MIRSIIDVPDLTPAELDSLMDTAEDPAAAYERCCREFIGE